MVQAFCFMLLRIRILVIIFDNFCCREACKIGNGEVNNLTKIHLTHFEFIVFIDTNIISKSQGLPLVLIIDHL